MAGVVGWLESPGIQPYQPFPRGLNGCLSTLDSCAFSKLESPGENLGEISPHGLGHLVNSTIAWFNMAGKMRAASACTKSSNGKRMR